MSSDQTLQSPTGANKSIMSSPQSLSSPKKSERFKGDKSEKFRGIKFQIENTEIEPETPYSTTSPDRSPNRGSGIDPKMLIFKDERQFQTIQEHKNDDADETFNSPNRASEAQKP